MKTEWQTKPSKKRWFVWLKDGSKRGPFHEYEAMRWRDANAPDGVLEFPPILSVVQITDISDGKL